MDNLINRQDAIHIASGYCHPTNIAKELAKLPSAQPKCKRECMPMYANVSDYISRQAAIDEAYEIIIDGQKFEVVQVETLMGLPPAQPEIIRCRDCKHYYYADNRIPQEQMYTCDLDGDRWSPDSYCSFAEREEDE